MAIQIIIIIIHNNGSLLFGFCCPNVKRNNQEIFRRKKHDIRKTKIKKNILSKPKMRWNCSYEKYKTTEEITKQTNKTEDKNWLKIQELDFNDLFVFPCNCLLCIYGNEKMNLTSFGSFFIVVVVTVLKTIENFQYILYIL